MAAIRFLKFNIILFLSRNTVIYALGYKVLKGDVGLKVRELIRQTWCEAFEIEILKGVVSQDHVHVLVSAPANLAPSEIIPTGHK